MTAIFLDGNTLDIERKEGQQFDPTLGDLITAIEGELKRVGHLIYDVWGDGIRLEDWSSRKTLRSHLSDFRELKLFSAPAEAIVLEGHHTVQEYIGFIKEKVNEAVRRLRLGESDAGEIDCIIEGLNEIVKTTDSIYRGAAARSINLFSMCDPSIYYGQILKNVEDLVESRSSGDVVYIADVLEYELLKVLNEFEKRLFCGPE